MSVNYRQQSSHLKQKCKLQKFHHQRSLITSSTYVKNQENTVTKGAATLRRWWRTDIVTRRLTVVPRS